MFLQYFLKFLITQQSHVYSFLSLLLPEHRVRAVSEHLSVVNLMMKNLTFAIEKQNEDKYSSLPSVHYE